MTLPTSPIISLSVTQLGFEKVVGSADPAPQSVSVTNAGSGVLGWQVQTNVGWLSASPASGTAPATMTVAVAASGLAPGTHSGILTISSAATPTKTIAVTLNVRTSGASSVEITSVVSGASFGPAVAPSGWITITGKNLARTSRTWRDSEIVGGRLPTSLDGVSVSIAGRPAFVYYISPTQINVQAPSEIAVQTSGTPVEVRVSSPDGAAVSSTRFTPVAPALFTYPLAGEIHAAAVHPDGVLVGPGGAIPGTTTRAARSGEIVLLYATGIGLNTDPSVPAGFIPANAAAVKDPLEVTIGGLPARIIYAGLVSPGLYQLNVVVPTLETRAQSVKIRMSGVESEGQVLLMVQ